LGRTRDLRGANAVAAPFDWKFTRDDLASVLARLEEREPQLQLAA